MPKRKIPPVPDPPDTLINLIRKDGQVRKYFEALQANLQADVRKWKDRAATLQAEKEPAAEGGTKIATERPQRKKAQLKIIDTKDSVGELKQSSRKSYSPHVRLDSSSDNEGNENPSPLQEFQSKRYQGKLCGEESIGGAEANDPPQAKKATSNLSKLNQIESSSDDDEYDDSFLVDDFKSNLNGKVLHTEIGQLVRHAKEILETLGIELARIPSRPTESETQSVDAQQLPLSFQLQRVSDEDVVAKMLHVLHTAAHSRGELFDADGFPCCNQPSAHASATVKAQMYYVLLIMDAIPISSLPSEAWSTIAKDPTISVDFLGRQDLVQTLLDSLASEVAVSWPQTDRSRWFSEPILHLNSADSSQNAPLDMANSNSTSDLTNSKAFSRLATLVERCMIVQLLVAIFRSRHDEEGPRYVFWKYLLSSFPSKSEENYLRLPPTLSFLIIEAITTTPDLVWWRDGSDWQIIEASPALTLATKEVVSLVMEITAGIWYQRKLSNEERIRDVARIECAAFKRIQERGWLPLSESPTNAMSENVVQNRVETLLSDYSHVLRQGKCPWSNYALQILFVLAGKFSQLPVQGSSFVPEAILNSRAIRQLTLRQLDNVRRAVGSNIHGSNLVAHAYAAKLTVNFDTPDMDHEGMVGLLQCALELGNGEVVLRLATKLADQLRTDENQSQSIFEVLKDACEYPTVRVINLERRVDRWQSFLAHCIRERLIALKGVCGLLPESYKSFGRYAFDGGGRLVEARNRLISHFGSERRIEKLVRRDWCPGDLRPFDRAAPKDDGQVALSLSECACALSHISTWQGVVQSLKSESPNLSTFDVTSRRDFHLSRMKRSFAISGHARGAALLKKNQSMPPSPVCVIFEDDAILCEHFAARLKSLLDEVPRDFHFLSLGYSRPKTAPIVPFRSKVGIPTGLWYLTGYVLSLKGAEFLLDHLPVHGPVDSWMALLMLRNWDNIYGHAIGVGNRPRPNITAPPQSDLVKMMEFHAYCAMTPLCHQQLSTASSEKRGRSWRSRDTDIVYSGGEARH